MLEKIIKRLGVCILLLGLAANAWGAQGDLDLSWDGDGWAVATAPQSRGDIANALAIQPDGKVVAAGLATTPDGGLDFYLVRFNPNGSLDSSFGTGGRVLTNFVTSERGSADFIQDILIQADGKILAAGGSAFSSRGSISQNPNTNGDMNFALARYLPDGSLDTGFGNGGTVSWDFSGIHVIDQINAVSTDGSGKILVAGYVTTARGATQHDFALARLNPDGSLDTSFGMQGMVRTDLAGGSDDLSQDMAILSDGNILLAGTTTGTTLDASDDFALVRYLPDGQLDVRFGNGGVVITNLAENPSTVGLRSDDQGRALVVLPDGRIRVGGSTADRNLLGEAFAVVAYLPDGSPDRGFGADGRALLPFPGHFASAMDMKLDADGDLLLAGNAAEPSSVFVSQFALARLNPDGSFDLEFSQDGRVLEFLPGFPNGLSGANALALQDDGKVLAAGFAEVATDGEDHILGLTVARFQASAQVPENAVPSQENPGESTQANRPELSLSGGGCTLSAAPEKSSVDAWLLIWISFSLLAGRKLQCALRKDTFCRRR